MRHDSCVDFGVYEFFVCVFTWISSPPFFLLYFLLSLCFLSYLFISLLVYILPTFSRIDPFRFQVGGRRSRVPGITWSPYATKPGFSFFGLFYVVVYFVTDACLLSLCLFEFFSTKPRDWIGRTSPKWPILCRVHAKNLNSINQSINLNCVAVLSCKIQKF